MRFFLILLILMFPAAARAERLQMKDGDRISGAWLDSDATTIRFTTKYGSVVRVPRDQIAAYYNDAGQAVALPPPAAAPLPKPVEAAESKPAPKKDEPGFLGATWKNRVNAGAGLQSGNSDQKSLNADFDTRAKWNKDRANLDLDYNWAQSEEEQTQDNRSASGNYDRFLDPSYLGDDKWYVNTNADLRQDKVAELKLRSVLGVGLGRQFYETDKTYLSASLGPSWLRQDFYEDETESSIAARWNVDYDQKFFDNLFSLFHKESLFIPSDDVSAYLFDAESGIRVPLKDGLSASLGWDLNINNDPPEDAERSDSTYSLKIGYEW